MNVQCSGPLPPLPLRPAKRVKELAHAVRPPRRGKASSLAARTVPSVAAADARVKHCDTHTHTHTHYHVTIHSFIYTAYIEAPKTWCGPERERERGEMRNWAFELTSRVSSSARLAFSIGP